jgi:hypothetical protein
MEGGRNELVVWTAALLAQDSSVVDQLPTFIYPTQVLTRLICTYIGVSAFIITYLSSA